MAEGGGGNENDNPFTYQTFVTNRGCTGADDSERTVENNKETGDATSTSACTKLTVNPISTSSDVQNRDQHCHAHCQSQTSQTQSQAQPSQSQTQTSQSQSQSRSQSYTSHDRHGADLGLASGSASASSASDAGKTRQSCDDANPFSFKKFLQFSTNPRLPAVATHAPTTFDLASDLPHFASQPDSGSDDDDRACVNRPVERLGSQGHNEPLPDFALQLNSVDVDGRSTATSVGDGFVRQVAPPSACLPDFTLQLNSVVDVRPAAVGDEFVRQVAPPSACLPDFTLQLNSVVDGRPAAVGDESVRQVAPPAACLPDFALQLEPPLESRGVRLAASPPGGMACLPDFLTNNVVSAASGLYDGAGGAVADRNASLTQLRADNTRLQAELVRCHQLVSQKADRVDELLLELRLARRREAEETASLTEMVQNVEANLRMTTERALSAERRVQELEHRLEAAQAKTAGPQATGAAAAAAAPPGGDYVNQVHEASEQLAMAARKADETIQQMVAGIDVIRMVSGTLASLGKMSEMDPSSSGSRGSRP